jgi:hypothetical protein
MWDQGVLEPRTYPQEAMFLLAKSHRIADMRRDDRKPNLALRRARGRFSQVKLAELVNHEILRTTGSIGAVTAKSISDWERGWYWWLSAHVRAALCTVLEVPDAADLGFRKRRSTHDDPARMGPRRSADVSRFSLTELHVDMPTADRATTTRLAVTGGRNFAGTEITAQFRLGRPHEHHQLTVHTSRDQAFVLSRPGDRGLLIAVDFDAETVKGQ